MAEDLFLFSLKTVIDHLFSEVLNIWLKSFKFSIIYTDANMAGYFVRRM